MWRVATISSAGGRDTNQDAFGVASENGVQYVVVCDGLGGHSGGEEAARTAAEASLASFRRNPAAGVEAISAHAAAAQEAVRRLQESHGQNSGMRTTFVALLAAKDLAVWAHAGDSRLYFFRGGRLLRRTKDHSVPQSLADAGEISEAQIRGHEDRSRLLRALGGPGEPRVAPGGPEPAGGGDAFLLCTDGFWEWVEENEMEACLPAPPDPAAWLAAMERLVRARATGEFDNYTAVALQAERS